MVGEVRAGGAARPVAERLAGQHLLLTGATGFVGEAFLERVLADLPATRVTVVARASRGTSAADRVAALLAKPAFARARATTGEAEDAEAVAALLATRVAVLEGELGGDLPPLPAEPFGLPDVVVHCAGEVSFDPPVDEGFRTNLTGTLALLEAVRASGATPHVLHVSTAYVAGLRSGWVAEEPHPHRVDWRAEAAAAERARDAAEVASRAPGVLADLLREAREAVGSAGPQAVAAEAERLRVRWVRKRLVEAGRQRALSLGWADCYTLTKALTERAVEETCAAWGVPLTVFRPTIIESALERPHPGWIEGFKMAEPIILSYGRGELPDFPASPDAAIDVIPVDLVVAAMVVAAATPPPVGTPSYLHCGSSARNPLRFRRLYELVRGYFLEHPLPARDQASLRGHHEPPVWSFAGEHVLERRLRVAERAHRAADRAVGLLPPGERARDAARRVDRLARRLRTARRLSELYRAYTQAELVYADDRLVALRDGLSEADRDTWRFDATAVDWHHYLVELHCPAVTAGLRWVTLAPRPPLPAPRPVQEARSETGRVVAAFDMDGTLLASTVVEAYLWTRLADAPRSALARLREAGAVGLDLPRLALADKRSRASVVRAVARRYAGADPEALAALVDDVVAAVLLRKLAPAAVRAVRAHRAAGHHTVLVTGALDVLARPVAPLFDEVRAASLQVGSDGRATGRLAEPPVVGEARAAWLRRRAAVEGWDLAASYAYADSLSDLPMLAAVGNPVAVNPDVALQRHARRAGWPVLRWDPVQGTGRLHGVLDRVLPELGDGVRV